MNDAQLTIDEALFRCRIKRPSGKPLSEPGSMIDVLCTFLEQLRLVWAAALPTRPGWYWWRPGADTDKIFAKRLPPGIYQLAMCGIPGDKSLYLALPKDRNRYPAKWLSGEWAGPISEPTHPAEEAAGDE